MWQRHVLIALVWGWLLAQHVSPVQGATIQLTATGSGDSAAFLQKVCAVYSMTHVRQACKHSQHYASNNCLLFAEDASAPGAIT